MSTMPNHSNSLTTEHHSHSHPAHFSRASHFFMILTPMALGVIYILVRDYLLGLNAPAEGLTDSIKISLLYGRTAWLRIGVFLLWAFGIGGGLLFLKGITQLEQWEESHPTRHQ